MNWRVRLKNQWQELTSALWYRPAVGTILAIILALVITAVDQMPYFTAPTLLRIGVDSARAVLNAIAGAMLTVVGMIFPILMVVLVLASQQFSPRILRNFAQDRVSQTVLSIFIGSFIYSLLVLARISEHEDRVFTPVFSVTGALILALISIGAFIYFIDHITRMIRANYIVADINRQTEHLLKKLFDEDRKELAPKEVEEEEASWHAAETTTIRSPRPGSIQHIDTDGLLRIAEEYGISIKVERSVGDFIARDVPLLTVMPGQQLSQALLDAIYGTIEIGTERTMLSDALFGIRQLVDIALRAISPGINDPTTAVTCIDYLGNLLVQAARHADAAGRFRDEEGRVRVIVRRPTFVMMLDLAFEQIRHYSEEEVTITLRMLDRLAEIAQATNEPLRLTAIWRHAAMISRSVARNIHEPVSRKRINDRLQELAARCGGRLAGVQLDNAEDPTEMVESEVDEEARAAKTTQSLN